MWSALILAVAIATETENLLLNPGFEVLDGDKPARWDVFVMPMNGAEGTVDSEVVHVGRNSVRLHIPHPYPKEPYNNWSQNVVRDLSGAELQLTGFVKTEGASDAALWLQCFRREPYGVAAIKSSGAEYPVFGDMDWTRVEVRLRVPPDTAYVTVRCVLKGRGTAWFDDLSLTRTAVASAPEKTVAPPAPTAPVREKSIEPPAKLSEEEIRELIAANEAIRKTAEEMRRNNELLSLQVQQLQAELQMLRGSLARPMIESDELSALAIPRVPPLVPHGAKPESYR